RIEETGDTVRLWNSHTGISIRRKLNSGAGPIEGVRLKSGKWVAASRLRNAQSAYTYTVEIVSRGPVSSEIVCRLHGAGEVKWELRVRMQANEPVILVDERFAFG